MKKALLLLLLGQIAWGAYTITLTPSCTICNLNDTVNFTAAFSPSITTTNNVTAYVAEFIPPVITIVRGTTANWKFIDNSPYTHVVRVQDDGSAWQTPNLVHNSIASYTFDTIGFYSYRLQPPIEGAPTTTVGNITIEEKPGLNITTPSSAFSLELNGSGTSYFTSYFLSASSPIGKWTVDLNYTDSKNNTGKVSASINVTTNMVINVSALPQIGQEQNIALPMIIRRAAGTPLLAGETAPVTCNDLTQNQLNTTTSSGASATCNFANLTVFGVHTVQINTSFANNFGLVLAYYNVSYYYQTALKTDSLVQKYNLGTTANLTASITPRLGVPGDANFTILEPGAPAQTASVSGDGNFSLMYIFGNNEGPVNISFDFVDAQGRRAHQTTSVLLTKNLTIQPAFPYLRQEGNITANITVLDVNNKTLSGADITYTDLNETMGCTPQTDVSGSASCTFNGIKNFGWHTILLSATRGSVNKGNLTTSYFVDGYYPTTLKFRRVGTEIGTINLKEFFDISVIPTSPGGGFLEGVNVTGVLTNTMNCMPTYTTMSGEYLWRACDGGSAIVQQTITFRYNGTDGHVAYATQNITVSNQYTLSVTPQTAEFVAGQSSLLTVAVKDINGFIVSGANVTCGEGTGVLTSTSTSDSGTAACSISLPVGKHTINMTAKKNYNSGSLFNDYVFSTTGSTQGPATVAIPPQMEISDYVPYLNITAGTKANARFTLWNKGIEKAQVNYIRIGTISPDWFTSPRVEVLAGEKKDVLVEFRIPADAQPMDYSITATLVGTLCGSKVVYPNGTYYYVGGDCDTKPFKLYIRSELQTAVAKAKENLTITTDKQIELSELVEELNKIGLNSSQITSYLNAGNTGIAEAKKLLNTTDVAGASALIKSAEANYTLGIEKAKAELKNTIDPLLATVESKLATLTNASASEMDLVDEAKAKLSEAKADYAKGNYADTKAKLDQAYSLIKDLKPKAPPKTQPEAGFTLSYTSIALLLLLAALMVIGIRNKDAIKEKLSPVLDSLKGKQTLINKYVWPEKISSHEEGTLTISISLKNTFAAPIQNIEVIDIMPLGFTLIDGSFNTGAANIPVDIGKTLQGKAFRWKLPELPSGKSVNITYKAQVVPIGDQIKLPAATLKYTDRTGKETKQSTTSPLVDVFI